MTMVSVIIPCYNQGKFIDESVQSVLNSKYKEIEIIIVNDGSTDLLTNQYIENFSHPNVKIIQTINQGVSAARNTGIRASSGKYILPLDADDKISPDYISEAIKIFESDQSIKVVTCEVRLFGAVTGHMKLLDFSIENLICQNTLVCSSFFRKKDFELTSGYNSNMNLGFEDWDFWLTLLEKGGKVYRIPGEHFYYRIKKNSRNKGLQSMDSNLAKMRYQIYLNHKELYSSIFFNPLKSFEYDLLINSREYKLGKRLLKPIRFLLKWYGRLLS